MSFIVIYITHSDEMEARKIWDLLLEKKLIACYNMFPVTAAFWWENKIDTWWEVVTLIKTKKTNWEIVKKEIEENHSYDIPCIMKFEVESNKEFEDWIENETS